MSREHEGQSASRATSLRKYAALSPSGQHMRPNSQVAKTLPLHLMVCFGTGIMRHHMRMSTSGAGSPELFWSLLVWSVAVRASPPRSVSLRTGSNPDS